MKKGDICEGISHHIEFPNKGIVYLPEGTVIVKNTIPGQKIRFRIHKKRKNLCEGTLLEVLDPSPLETQTAVCRNFPACGGCMYQTMSYEDQLQMKAEQVRSLLHRALVENGQLPAEDPAPAGDYADTHPPLPRQQVLPASREIYEDSQAESLRPADIDDIFEGIKPSPLQWEYRNKMEFSFGDDRKDGPLTLGLHKKASTYDILTTDDCRIVHPDFTRVLRCTLDFFTSHPQPYYRKMQHEGYLRHLLLRRSQTNGGLLICLVTTTQAQPDLSEWKQALLDLQTHQKLDGSICGILHIYNDSLADIVHCDRCEILYGQDVLYETILGLHFQITPFSFFQTNTLGAQVLYTAVRDFAGSTKDLTIFDLYSGTGTIAQILAPVARKVIGVEIVEEAVEAARRNAQLNHLDNCKFIAGDVLKVLDTIPLKPDLIILDPPRDGIHPKALEKIIAYGVDRIIYISCKPTSLARDLSVLGAGGYRVERAVCVDMFPASVHVETVVLMSRKDRRPSISM